MEATGGCAKPVRLTGHSEIRDRDGAVLVERWGEILAPCGNRRASVCPACSDRYAGDAFHLLRAGLAGGAKDVPTTVTDKPRAFLTLTAPSFGPVHTRRTTPAGRAIPCGCRERHHPDDPRIGSPLDPDSYDYVGSVLWQAHAGQLWHRFTIALRRALAGQLGVPVRVVPGRRPAVLRQGRRVPAARAGPLPRRRAGRRTRRPRRPGPGRGHRGRAARGGHHRGRRRRAHRRSGRTGHRSSSAGAPSSTSGRSRAAGRGRGRGRRRADQRGPAGRLRRQVRHQGHRRHRGHRPPDPRRRPHPVTSTSPRTTAGSSTPSGSSAASRSTSR